MANIITESSRDSSISAIDMLLPSSSLIARFMLAPPIYYITWVDYRHISATPTSTYSVDNIINVINAWPEVSGNKSFSLSSYGEHELIYG